MRKIKLSITNYQFPIYRKGLAPLEISRPWASVKSLTGFTLIELMVVIAIIGILASIMIPNVIKHLEKGKEARAIADIDVLVKAVGLFQIDNGKLPGKDLGELWTEGRYISTDQTQSLKTPWGGKYSLTDEGNAYTIATTDIGNDGNPKVSKTITFE